MRKRTQLHFLFDHFTKLSVILGPPSTYHNSRARPSQHFVGYMYCPVEAEPPKNQSTLLENLVTEISEITQNTIGCILELFRKITFHLFFVSLKPFDCMRGH